MNTDPRATDPLTPPEWEGYDRLLDEPEFGGPRPMWMRPFPFTLPGRDYVEPVHHHGRYMLFAALVGVVIGWALTLLASRVVA